MNYLDYEQLNKIQAREFRTRKPFPWTNPEGVLTEEAFRHLLEHLPDISVYESRFGYSRNFGQKGHDRYSLEYDKDLAIHPSWHQFVAELYGHDDRQFLRRLYGFRPMKLSFHWHYTPSRCTVSPHCDSRRKIGSHIFYLNTDENWKPEGVVKRWCSTITAASTVSRPPTSKILTKPRWLNLLVIAA